MGADPATSIALATVVAFPVTRGRDLHMFESCQRVPWERCFLGNGCS